MQIANILLDGGMNLNITHPLPKAAVSGRVELVQMLLAYREDINTVHPLYSTLLFNAGVVGKHVLAKFL